MRAALNDSAEKFLQARDLLLRRRDDYAAAYREFCWPELDYFNWAVDFFDVQAKNNSRLAIWVVEQSGEETKLTFAEMAVRSNRVANFLRAHGVKRGDRILIMLPNCIALWEVMLAVIKVGAVAVPTALLLTASEIQDRIERGGIGHIVAAATETDKFSGVNDKLSRICVGGAPERWAAFEDAYQASSTLALDGVTRAEDPQLLYFTSGTTARPKLVLHSQQSYAVGHLSTMYWIGLRPGDLHWNISSPGWAKHAWSCIFAPWNAGATVFTYNYSRFDARAILATLARCGITTLCAPPTVWRMLIQEDLSHYDVSLRELVGAGEPLNPEVIERVQSAWGIFIRDGFGQTETTCQIGNPPGQRLKLGSMGRAMPGYKVVLLDSNENHCDEGEIALDLASKPAGLMLGYQDDHTKTAEVRRTRYYHTGDLAVRDSDGYYTYIGRTDDVFKASDYRISPFELESILIEHDAIAEAAVVPSPDPTRLAVPKAFIALSVAYAPTRDLANDILKFVSSRLAPYKRVRRIEFCTLPKTISGKIRRVELRNMEFAQFGSPRRPTEFWEEDFEKTPNDCQFSA
jgi:acetyl-CoA synthetase